MDPNDFCTDLNPYEYGIVDTINQALAQGSHSAGKGFGVKAELYKLNVGVSQLSHLSFLTWYLHRYTPLLMESSSRTSILHDQTVRWAHS